MRANAFLRAAASALLWFGCSAEEPHPELGFKVQSLTSDGLPTDVTSVRVTWKLGDRAETTREAPVGQLDTDDGRTQLTIERIPENTPIRVTIEGVSGSRIAYAGTVGPLILTKDEQVSVRVVLYTRDRSEMLPGTTQPAGRFLHASTRLADGRVLVSGGFGAPKAGNCPEGVATGSLCFDATALGDAWLFDPASASFHAVREGLLSARGGHTSTLLPDGRVVVSGGASHIKVVLEKQGDLFTPHFLGVNGTLAASLASFELFEPGDEATSRDPARGAFVGPAGNPAAPGALETARFLHGAAASPVTPERVVLAGGADPDAAESYEVFDVARAGGPGVVAGSLTPLSTARTLPAVVALADGSAGWVWMFGGSDAQSNDDLAERWFGNDDDAVGQVAPATDSAFPNANSGESTARPTYAFDRPVTATLLDASQALVTGGLGPRCDAMGRAQYTSEAPLVSCSSDELLRQGFVVEAATGRTTRVILGAAHVLGAGASLPDGRAVVGGGFGNLALEGENTLHIVSVGADGDEAPALKALTRNMTTARALHTTTAFGQRGLLSVGGLSFAGNTLQLVAGHEVIWL